MKNITPKNLEINKMAMSPCDFFWDLLIKRDVFKKKTIGYQLVTSTGLKAAKVAERYGRSDFGKKRQF